ncbi:DUF1772 domain-containing protein [Ciceribacter thiooxidans]|uniref:DUF1772 domain-containing protein n=1 Tax=Ciceribacter thiooxidans TaxID=1969821 RepID=A0ABV7I4W9_9HYPH|nr:DUF1772 domain-containing protein [Ciceribacter thiooxidans]
MLSVLSVLVLLLMAVNLGLALAHALEFPGKLRLGEPAYRAVQAIYYPGFTIGGLVGEVGGMLLLIVLLVMTPAGTVRFWWEGAALGLLVAGHSVYWVATHPVNAFWLKDSKLATPGRLFFGLLSAPGGDWRRKRSIWEWSHVVRAVFFALGFLSMALALMR